jgi:hypothetical protein
LRKLDAPEGGRSSFQLEDSDREVWTGRKVVLATGIQDIFPDIPGFDTIWGKSVVHCVFCHGTETKGQPIALLMNPALGPAGAHGLMMFFTKFTNLNNDPVTIIANGVFGEGATEPKPAPEYGITADIIDLAKHRGYDSNNIAIIIF